VTVIWEPAMYRTASTSAHASSTRSLTASAAHRITETPAEAKAPFTPKPAFHSLPRQSAARLVSDRMSAPMPLADRLSSRTRDSPEETQQEAWLARFTTAVSLDGEAAGQPGSAS
jgi:hypothetical protein